MGGRAIVCRRIMTRHVFGEYTFFIVIKLSRYVTTLYRVRRSEVA